MLNKKFLSKESINKYRILVGVSISGLICSLIFYGGLKEFYDIVIKMIISIPINVMITNIFIDSTLKQITEKKEQKKVNALINIFYIEVGNDILEVISKADKCEARLRALSEMKDNFSAKKCKKIFDEFDNFKNCINMKKLDIELLKQLLENATPINLELLTSASLEDREDFGKIVQEIFILKKELDRKDIDVRKEIEKLYVLLGQRWVTYMSNSKEFRPDGNIYFPYTIKDK